MIASELQHKDGLSPECTDITLRSRLFVESAISLGRFADVLIAVCHTGFQISATDKLFKSVSLLFNLNQQLLREIE
jgi:hypothetical protein